MTLVNRAFLKLALLPQGFYRKSGINTTQLKAILATKLTMDDRRHATWRQTRRRNNDKPVKLATVFTMIWSAILGVFFLFLLSIGNDAVTQLTFYFTAFFVMLSLTLISDFTSVLIDVRDNFIILPKPVNDRTVVVARLLHIFIHLSKLILPMALPAVVYMSVNKSPGGGLLFLLLVFLLTAFSIFFINAVYLLLLKLTTPQRFQSVIGYVQIMMAVLVYGSYQIFPRLLVRLNLLDFNVASLRGIGFYPLYWLAQTWKVVYGFKGSATEVLFAVAGVMFPLLCVWAVVRFLAPSFNRKVSLIAAATDATPVRKTPVRTPWRGYAGFWSRLLTTGTAEKSGFDFTWKMTARSRDFKLKVYPSMGYLLVYAVILLLNNRKLNLGELRDAPLAARTMIVSGLYFLSFLLVTAAAQVAYSEKFKAAWIYFTAPLQQPGQVITGSAKAVITKFYLPFVFILTAAGLYFGGLAVLPNIVLGLFNQVLILALRVYLHYKNFPFSLHQSSQEKAGAFLRSLAVLFVSGTIAVGHYLIYPILPAVLLCAALSVVASWLLFDALRNLSWAKIQSRYAEE